MATVAGSKRLLDISGNNISTAVSLTASGTLLDTNGAAGASNQILSSTGSGVDWVNASSVIGGPYLPLAAGSGSPLTGDLYITKNSPVLTITDTVASDLKLEIKQSGSTSNFMSRGGTSSKGQFNFRITDGSTVTNALFINQQANVGIGTPSPGQKLDVAGNLRGNNVYINDSTVPGLYMERGDGLPQPVIQLVKSNDNLLIGNTAIDEVIFYDDAGEAMRLDGSGNLGIGTTNPTAKLHVQGSSDTDVPIIRSGGFGNSGSKLELAETLTGGNMNYGFSFFNDGNSSNTLQIKAHNNSTTGITAMTIDRGNALTTFGPVPVVGTRTAGDNTTRAASTAFVTTAITAAAPTVNDGTLTMTTTAGLDGGATFTANQSGDSAFAVSLDLSELTDMTQTMIGTDEFIVLDNGAERRKAANEIGLSIFNNDAGFTANIGDITAVVAGTGLTGGGTSGSVTLNVAGGTYTPYNDIRSLGVPAFTNGTNPNITTAQVMDEIDSDGGFDSYSSVFKTSWSYAGNYNLTDAGDFTETAGSSWITWTDNSSDSARGNITTLAIAPNTGGSAGGVFIYNNQGGSYSPGWRQVWTSMTDGAGSGLDADLLDGQQGSYYLNYANFTGTPTIPSVGNGQIDGRTSGLGLSGSMDATANQSGDTTFTVTSNAVTAANANTIAYRTSSADIRARLFRSNYANQSTISGGMAFRVNNGTDDYIRFCSNAGAIRTFLGVPASGDLNNYLLNTTDTFTGALTIDGELEMANGPNGIIYTTDDILTLSSGGKTSGTNIAIDDAGSVIKLNSDTIALGEFKVSSLTDGTGNDVFRALVTSSNSSFSLGDIEGLGDGSYIASDGTTIKLRNNGGINTLVTDNSNNVEIPNGNLLISNQIGVNTTNFNPQAGIIVNGNQTFGTPGGGTNVNSRYLSIEGGADGAGEGSGRIFFTEHNSTTAAMDNYGMSLGYRGGPTSIVGASGETWSGLSQIGNGEWGMWGHNNSANGALIMYGDRAATYVDFSGNNIQGITNAYIANQIIHTGDTNTYMQFHAADQWRVVTGGSERLEVNNTQVTVANNLQVGGSIYASQYIYHTGDTNTFMRFPANDTISWNTAGAERMRINSSGNVGIGTTAPGSDLEIFNTSGSTVISEARISSLVTSGYGGQSNLWLRTSNYGNAMIAFGNQNGSSAVANSASGKITYNSYNRIFTVTADSNALLTLGGSTDRVGVNQTNPQYTLDVTGNGRFTSTVTATNFILSSDEKLKENVEKVCGNKVEAEWKTFELKTEKGQKRYGVIAQELEKTNPEFVREDSQGFKSVAYIDLLIAKIAELEARLEKLEK